MILHITHACSGSLSGQPHYLAADDSDVNEHLTEIKIKEVFTLISDPLLIYNTPFSVF